MPMDAGLRVNSTTVHAIFLQDNTLWLILELAQLGKIYVRGCAVVSYYHQTDPAVMLVSVPSHWCVINVCTAGQLDRRLL